MSLRQLKKIYNNAKKSGYKLGSECKGNWLKCRSEWEKYATNPSKNKTKKQKTNRSVLWKEAKELGYPTSEYNKATNENLKDYISSQTELVSYTDIKVKTVRDVVNEIKKFAGEIDEGDLDISEIDVKLLPKILEEALFDKTVEANPRFVFMIRINGNTIRTLSPNYLRRLADTFDPNNENYYSEYDIPNLESIILEKRFKIKREMNNTAFFPFVLTELGKSFPEVKEAWDRYVPEEGEGRDCLGHSIKIAEDEGRVAEGTYDKYVSYKIDNTSAYSVRLKDYKPLSERLETNIILHVTTENEKGVVSNRIIKNIYCDDEHTPTLELYSLMNHCFLDEKTIFTPWSIEVGYTNDDVEVPNGNIYDMREANGKIFVNKHSSRKMSSINFLRKMIANNGLTQPMTQSKMLDQINYEFKLDHTSDITCGFVKPEEKIRKAMSPFHNDKNPNEAHYDERIYADYETIVEKDSDGKLVHLQDMLVTMYKGKIRTYISVDVYRDPLPATRFLDAIHKGVYGKAKNHIVIFHNLGYDINFIMKDPNITPMSRLQTSSAKTKCFKTMYFGKIIYFKDSYSVISYPLSSFKDVFGFTEEYKKGACPYNYYTNTTIKERWANTNTALKHVKNSDKDVFMKSIEPYLNPENKHQFNHNQHRLDYCIQDVRILARGYETFREWVSKLFEEDLDFCVSIPQIAHNHLNNKGVFNGVSPVSDIALHYLQNFIVGGRCLSAYNEKYIIETGIQDLDANSLYPSAMCRNDFDIPLGSGRKITEKEIMNWKTSDLKKYSSAYLSINILSVGKKRAFPTIHSREKGFTNEPSPTETIYVGKVMLEEIIKYHAPLKYKVLGGIVFDNSKTEKSTALKTVIEELYEKRCELKAEGKKSEQLVKLIMNAAYGRMIMKPHDTSEVFMKDYKGKGEKRYKEFTHRHFNSIKEIVELDSFAIIEKHKSVLDHQNYATLGINILDMTKRIMNEVMYLAEDNGINIYYQDTDSMHMDMKDVGKIEELFKAEYNRDLIAKGKLQQFCTDFDVPRGFEKPYAKTCIIVGKKCYLDVVESQSSTDPNVKHIDFVSRMKGIPQRSIEEKAAKVGGLEVLYRNLYNGKKYRFDMLANGGVSFDFNNFEVTSKPEFYREIFFE